MKYWKILALGILASFSLGLLEVRAEDEKIRIVVVAHGQATDPFWSVVKNGVDQAQNDMGVTVEYLAPDTFDMVKMAQLIDAAVASKPDGIAVSIPDADALGESIKAAVASGIPVVSFNSGSDVRESLGVKVHVGQTEFEAGEGGGKKFKEAGLKNVIVVNQEVGNVALDLRGQGCSKGFGKDCKVLAVAMDPTEIKNAVSAAISEDPTIDGILTLGPTAAEPTLAALEEAGVVDKVKLGTFDLSPNVLKALNEGKMLFAIDQQQYLQGYLPVTILTLFNKYGLMPGADVLTGPGFVTQENAAQVIDLSSKGIR